MCPLPDLQAAMCQPDGLGGGGGGNSGGAGGGKGAGDHTGDGDQGEGNHYDLNDSSNSHERHIAQGVQVLFQYMTNGEPCVAWGASIPWYLAANIWGPFFTGD